MTPKKAREILIKQKKPLEQNLLKNITDKIIALILVIALSPIIIIIIIALFIEKIIIRDSSVFIDETRVSLGKDFQLLKFSTIRKSALLKGRKSNKNIKEIEQNPKNFTTVGSALHKVYLDEIPQLFNVIKGDMNLIGPRPYEKNDYLITFKEGETAKSLIKPGITGLVQIYKGTKKASLLSDYEYIYKYMTCGKLRFFFYDIKILLKTVVKIFKAEGY